MDRISIFLGVLLAVVAVASAQDACSGNGAVLSGTSGSFATANPYRDNQKCRWTVNVTSGKAVHLSFNRFALESATGCSYDKVIIYDADAVDRVLKNPVCSTASAALPSKFGPFCGTNTPDPILTTGNRIVVEFCSDTSGNFAGFDVSYREVFAPPTTAAPPTGADCNIQAQVDGKFQIVFSNTQGYAAYQKCWYKLSSKNGKTLKVNAQLFSMEGIIGCRYDRVALFDGTDDKAQSLGIYCGVNGPKNVRTSGSDLYVTFVSDQYTNGKGFILNVEESCSGDHLCANTDPNAADQCYSEQQFCDGTQQCASGQDESSCADDCGNYPSWTSGQPFPGAAALTHVDGQIHCGGALINSHYVLTTAHCFHRLDNKPERFVVKLGAARLADAYVGQIEKITVHPLFNPKTLANNLALVKLQKPAPIQSSIAPFCMPFTSETINLAEGTTCYTLGWGRTNPTGINSYASSVKQFTATILNNSRCRWNNPVVVDNNSICASTSGSLCYGDNGAPLVCKHGNGKWQLYGINSVAFGCTGGSTIPSAFVKTSAFSSWIRDNAF